MALPHFQFVEDSSAWASCLETIEVEPKIAIDLEANSLFAYREEICLIQLSVPGADFIVDPIAGFDFKELSGILGNPAIEKIFHAAEYDLILLMRQFGWSIENLFDTMWASRILGLPRSGLANLLHDFYGLEHNKKHQKANWCRRPLTKDQLAYAQIDTHYLLQLRDDLYDRLAQEGLTQEAKEIFEEQTNVSLPDTSFDPDGFWKINDVRKLSGTGRAVARVLYIYRDQQARKQNRPPFKIFQDRTIAELAKEAPGSLDQLARINGMSKGQIRRYGNALLSVISKAKSEPPPLRPKRKGRRPQEDVSKRYERLHNWRKQKARARGVESDVILSRETLWALARKNPASPQELKELDILGPCRFELYCDEIVSTLDGA